jgi:tryptophanyl-tRNA synthetase
MKDELIFNHNGTDIKVRRSVYHILESLTKDSQELKKVKFKLVGMEKGCETFKKERDKLRKELDDLRENTLEQVRKMQDEIRSAKLDKYMKTAEPSEILKTFIGVLDKYESPL